MSDSPSGISIDSLTERNLILVIEEGHFKGRKMIIDKELAKKPVTTAMVENGELFGRPKFSMACLVHDTFVPSGGCPDCKDSDIKE